MVNESVGCSEEGAWASFIGHSREHTFTADVLERGRQIILDVLACSAYGQGDATVSGIAAAIAHKGTSSVIGSSLRATVADAALVNGISAAWCQLDEVNFFARQHPAAHTVPAAFAVAEHTDANLQQLLRAVIVGYEIGARLGRATRLRPEVHAHGTHGVVGGTVSAALLLGGGPDDVLRAIRVAASTVQSSSSHALDAGANVFHAFAGFAGQHAVTSALLAAHGLDGDPRALDVAFGNILGTELDVVSLTEGLGEDFLLMRNLFKYEPYCADLQPSIRALENALRNRSLRHDDVLSVNIRTFASAAEHPYAQPPSADLARFSLPFIVASRIVHGRINNDLFLGSALADPAVCSLAHRVRVAVDVEATCAFPALLSAEVMVETRSLGALNGRYVGAPQSDLDPASTKKLRNKAKHLLEFTLPAEQAKHAVQSVLSGSPSTSVRSIASLFSLASPRR